MKNMLTNETKNHLIAYSKTVPEGMSGRIATSADIANFENEFYPIPDDYKWILMNCVRIFFKAEWVDDIDELFDTHKKYIKESSHENGWTMKDVFIIGWDGAGNPYGIEESTGNIVVKDHNFGGVHILASNLEEVLNPNHKKEES